MWPVFESLGSDLYRNMVADMKKYRDKGKPPQYRHIGDEEWAMWHEYWSINHVEDQSYKNRQNRLTEPQDGKGSARHHYGSRAVVTDRQMSVSIYMCVLITT